jgi:hypothetical protein
MMAMTFHAERVRERTVEAVPALPDDEPALGKAVVEFGHGLQSRDKTGHKERGGEDEERRCPLGLVTEEGAQKLRLDNECQSPDARTYPNAAAFKRITAVARRPFSLEQAQIPPDDRIIIASGVDLTTSADDFSFQVAG